MTLRDAAVGKTYIIESVEGRETEKRRLLDMGFTPYCEITLLTRSPSGGATLVALRGFTVALRDDAAQLITLEAGL